MGAEALKAIRNKDITEERLEQLPSPWMNAERAERRRPPEVKSSDVMQA